MANTHKRFRWGVCLRAALEAGLMGYLSGMLLGWNWDRCLVLGLLGLVSGSWTDVRGFLRQSKM